VKIQSPRLHSSAIESDSVKVRTMNLHFKELFVIFVLMHKFENYWLNRNYRDTETHLITPSINFCLSMCVNQFGMVTYAWVL
jgi:hypothetical protein